MTDVLLRLLLDVTLGLALVLALRRPARRLFGPGPSFLLWLLPVVLALAPLLPQRLLPASAVTLPALIVSPSMPLAAAHTGASFDWVRVLLALWAVGAAFACVRLAWRYVLLRRGVCNATPAIKAAAGRALTGVDVCRVRLHTDGPAVLAAWPRALLLLPADFDTRFGNATTRDLVLRHEATHLARGDAWWSLTMELASALLWFHPLAWFARPRFRLDQELACDAAALRHAPERAAGYARALLDSVAVQPLPALIPWLEEPQLKERIAMLAKRVPGAMRRRVGFVAIAVLLGGGVFAINGEAAVPPASGASAGTVPASVDVSYKNRNPPRYPVAAAQDGKHGLVILDVTVNAAGAVTGLAVDQKGTTAPPELQAAAVTAAGAWKFNPGRKDGKPVGGVIRIPVEFSLTGMDGKPYKAPCKAGSQYVAQTKQCVKLVQPATSAR